MRDIELALARLAPEALLQRLAVLLRQLAGQNRRGFGIVAQVEDLLARDRVAHRITGRRLLDLRRQGAEAVFAPLLLHHGQPGALEELEETGRRRGPRPGARIQARFARSG